MPDELARLESRVATLEHSMRLWRRVAIVTCVIGGGIGAMALRAPQQVIDAERIILRGRAVTNGTRTIPAPRVELSVGAFGGLNADFSRDTAQKGNVALSPTELRLTDENGREVGRLGGVQARPLGK